MCPCENCVLYAMCRSKLADMSESKTMVGTLAETCILLHRYIYTDKKGMSRWFADDLRTNRIISTFRLFSDKLS